MNDEYELVSKEFIKNLKEENSKLKLELERFKKKHKFYSKELNPKKNNNEINSNNDDNFFEEYGEFSPIILEIKKEAKSEREQIIKKLNEIKELNEKSITNHISRSEILENKFEEILSSMKSLIEAINVIVSEFTGNDEEKLKQLIGTISKTTLEPLKIKESLDSFNDKIKEIEEFMENLKVLLSYVKPNDLVIDKKI